MDYEIASRRSSEAFIETIFLVDSIDFELFIDIAKCYCCIENKELGFAISSDISTHLADYLEDCLGVISEDVIVDYIIKYFIKIFTYLLIE